ncbi:MAG: shikimate kinase, partial [Candidatus Hodarchaeota archaeon]
MPKDSIALIGFMATGKTTVGKSLVDYLGKSYKFIETDQIIIEMAGKPIPRIFSEDGEEKFRDYEVKVCKKVSNLKNVVISCGGGIVLNEINIKNLKKNCFIVLLKASIEEIYRRVMNEGKELRPVIDKEDPMNEIEKVWKNRENSYNSSADII